MIKITTIAEYCIDESALCKDTEEYMESSNFDYVSIDTAMTDAIIDTDIDYLARMADSAYEAIAYIERVDEEGKILKTLYNYELD